MEVDELAALIVVLAKLSKPLEDLISVVQRTGTIVSSRVGVAIRRMV